MYIFFKENVKKLKFSHFILNLAFVIIFLSNNPTYSSILKEPSEIAHYKTHLRSSKSLSHPKVYRCGKSGSELVVNFVNNNYPNNDNDEGECRFKLFIKSPHICQVRVDFVDTQLNAPEKGECQDQQFHVEGSIWKTGIPPLCGKNNDQHFYIHLEPMSDTSNNSHVDFILNTLSPVTKSYRFGLWLTQIDCTNFNVLKAPEGCTQYFLGEKGSVRSFNYEGSRYLRGQNYQICIRPGRGVCAVRYDADQEGDFSMKKNIRRVRRPTNNNRLNLIRSGAGSAVCTNDYLLIPDGRTEITTTKTLKEGRLLFNNNRRKNQPNRKPALKNNIKKKNKKNKNNNKSKSKIKTKKVKKDLQTWDRFCGGNLSPKGGEMRNKPIYAFVKSNLISLRVKTSHVQSIANSNLTTGFKVNYAQMRDCDDEIMDNDMALQPTIINILQSLHKKGFTPPVFREKIEDDDDLILTRNSNPDRILIMDNNKPELSEIDKSFIEKEEKQSDNSTTESDEDKIWDYMDSGSEEDLYDF